MKAILNRVKVLVMVDGDINDVVYIWIATQRSQIWILDFDKH